MLKVVKIAIVCKVRVSYDFFLVLHNQYLLLQVCRDTRRLSVQKVL